MFTGLIEEVGTIKSRNEVEGGVSFEIACTEVLEDIKKGASISVNGACQTVEEFDKSSIQIFSVPETLEVTNYSDMQEGDTVNLERALRADSRLGGHIVQGHVEGVGRVADIEQNENFWNVHIEYSSPYLIPKGSVTVEGISLTLHEVASKRFTVQIIPETLRQTNLSTWEKGRLVNLETDYLVKAVDHMTAWRKKN